MTATSIESHDFQRRIRTDHLDVWVAVAAFAWRRRALPRHSSPGADVSRWPAVVRSRARCLNQEAPEGA